MDSMEIQDKANTEYIPIMIGSSIIIILTRPSKSLPTNLAKDDFLANF